MTNLLSSANVIQAIASWCYGRPINLPAQLTPFFRESLDFRRVQDTTLQTLFVQRILARRSAVAMWFSGCESSSELAAVSQHFDRLIQVETEEIRENGHIDTALIPTNGGRTSMPLYTAIGFDHPPHDMQHRNRLRQEHSAYVLANAERIRFATALYDAGGNQKGSVYIFEASDAETVWQWFAEEPFYRGNVYKDFRVEEILPAFNNLPDIQWPINQ